MSDSWGVFEKAPARRATVYPNTLSPTPWIFRGDPNKPFFVLVAMVGIWLGVVVGVWFAQNVLGG